MSNSGTPNDAASASRRVRIPDVRIAGMAAALPGTLETVDMLLAQCPSDEERASLQRAAAMSGTSAHYRALPSTTSGDLCAHAAERLLDTLGWDRHSVDVLLFASVTPDDIIPPSGYALHNRLGLGKQCIVLDALMGCTAFTHGLWLASSLLSGGGPRRALVLTGDTISRATAPDDLKSRMLLGDAGTATALEFTPGAAGLCAILGTDSGGAGSITQPGRGYRPSDAPPFFQMNGVKVFTFAHAVVPKVVDALLTEASLTREEVDMFYLHQANKMINEGITRLANIPAGKAPDIIGRFANCGSASIPLLVCASADGLPEDRDARVVFAGFGVGLSWSAASTVLAPDIPRLLLHTDL